MFLDLALGSRKFQLLVLSMGLMHHFTANIKGAVQNGMELTFKGNGPGNNVDINVDSAADGE